MHSSGVCTNVGALGDPNRLLIRSRSYVCVTRSAFTSVPTRVTFLLLWSLDGGVVASVLDRLPRIMLPIVHRRVDRTQPAVRADRRGSSSVFNGSGGSGDG